MFDSLFSPPGVPGQKAAPAQQPASARRVARAKGGKVHRLLFALVFTTLCAASHAETFSQQVVDEINLARTRPRVYAQILAARVSISGNAGELVQEAVDFLQKSHPLAPLSLSSGMSQAALGHALDTGLRGGRGHLGTRGDMPWDRIARFGSWAGYTGENIDYGHSDPRAIVIALILDEGVPGREHRANLFNRLYHVVGIGVGPHLSYGTICVMDFTTVFTEGSDGTSWRKTSHQTPPASGPGAGYTTW